MPEMEINVEGKGGHYAPLLQQYRHHGGLIRAPEDIPMRVETHDHGMQSGAPSVTFLIELPTRHLVVLAETSLKLFQLAAIATLGRYGDQTGGSFMGLIKEGTFTVQLSAVAKCTSCDRYIPGSCKYCPECGAKL